MAVTASCFETSGPEDGGSGPRGRVRLTPVDEGFIARHVARRAECVYTACDCVLDITAAFFNVPSRELRRPGRCADDISRVRQIAMYAAHVVLRFSMAEVGKGFGRDRTTVMHACHTVEDMRDDAEFDAMLMRIERVIAAAFKGRDGFPAED